LVYAISRSPGYVFFTLRCYTPVDSRTLRLRLRWFGSAPPRRFAHASSVMPHAVRIDVGLRGWLRLHGCYAVWFTTAHGYRAVGGLRADSRDTHVSFAILPADSCVTLPRVCTPVLLHGCVGYATRLVTRRCYWLRVTQFAPARLVCGCYGFPFTTHVRMLRYVGWFATVYGYVCLAFLRCRFTHVYGLRSHSSRFGSLVTLFCVVTRYHWFCVAHYCGLFIIYHIGCSHAWLRLRSPVNFTFHGSHGLVTLLQLVLAFVLRFAHALYHAVQLRRVWFCYAGWFTFARRLRCYAAPRCTTFIPNVQLLVQRFLLPAILVLLYGCARAHAALRYVPVYCHLGFGLPFRLPLRCTARSRAAFAFTHVA